jgi:hypothetical protein
MSNSLQAPLAGIFRSAAQPQPKMANGKWQIALVHARYMQFAQAGRILIDSVTHRTE